MKAHVDKDICIGCGLCEGISPKVFLMDDDGKAIAIEADIPESELDTAKEAAEQCPVEAIAVH